MQKIYYYRTLSLLFTVLISIYLSGNALGQEEREVELTAQEMLARVDAMLKYPAGILKGTLLHIQPNGSTRRIQLKAFIQDSNYLFRLETSSRGEEQKVLYTLNGEDIWVYNVLSRQLFHKMSIDKFDSLLNTNFFYIDLSNADLQSNYTASIDGEVFVKGRDALRLKCEPLLKSGEYGLLTLYVSKDDFIPLRIDYHDSDRVVFKTMSVAKVAERNNRKFPVRYDMLNIRTGTVTIFEIFDIDEKARFDRSIFRPEKLGEH